MTISAGVFVLRSKVISNKGNSWYKGFLEVETPVLQTLADRFR